MTVSSAVRKTPEHASAVRRLARARQEEALAEYRLSEGRADVASREQWLHWIEERESLAPWADGEWGPRDGRKRTPAPSPRSPHTDGSRNA